MAYDPKDPKDKEIVDGLIAAAVEEATAEFEGLKVKNRELIDKNKQLQKNANDPQVVANLETENEKLQGQVAESAKALKKAQKLADDTTKKYETETSFSRKLLVEDGLTKALAAVKVAPEFLPAVTALLSPKVTVVVDGESRKAMVGEKELGAFITEWSLGDEGKSYVSARPNAGGGAPGSKGTGNAKSMTRTAFEALPLAERGPLMREGINLTD